MHSVVGKTAHDALMAKVSAFQAGYQPNPLYGDVLLRLSASHEDDSRRRTTLQRQTPLVNAGYAIRVSIMIDRIKAFLSLHNEETAVQVIMIGAGLDALGLWCLQQRQQQPSIHVMEVDTPEIIKIKKEKVQQFDFIVPSRQANEYQLNTNANAIYTLLAVDLRNRAELDQYFLPLVRKDVPTLVLAEVVLAYLGEESCDQFISWCATHLCQSYNSCFVGLEPLGTNHSNTSVLEGYKRSYYQQFTNKLRKGGHQNDVCFHTLGCSCDAVQDRFQKLGFRRVHSVTAGKAATQQRWKAIELFDEHAALTLHLQSYTVVCAFGTECNLLLERLVCPWTTSFMPIRIGPYWISNVEIVDETPLRTMFQQTYQHLYEQYPAVKKMVKNVLKKDLAVTRSADQNNSASEIADWYQSRGGCYLVAVQYTNGSRTILGGIGVRLYDAEKQSFEVVRLLVHPMYRKKGVATALLSAIVKFLRKRHRCIELRATTLALLDEATAFYTSRGFILLKEDLIGGIMYQTFSNTFPLEESNDIYS